MSTIEQQLVREQIHATLSASEKRRREHQLLLARRLARKAERAALQARLALARAI